MFAPREAEGIALEDGAPCALALPAGPAPAPALPDDTHYAVLGLAPGATAAEVRRAYLRRVAAAHPDKGGDRAAFDRVQAAHAVLSDPTERLIYDEQLERRLTGSSSSSSGVDLGSGGSSSASGGDGSGRTLQSRGGVTAVVHGQTQGSHSHAQHPRAVQASCAGQGAGCASAELQVTTAAIQALQGGSGGGADAAAGLAAAYLRRAELHKVAGQLHHALFDAEESLRLQPGSAQAAALVGQLAAAAEELAACGGAAEESADGSDEDTF